MRIPLDYYRILGIPMAASEEQLRQAYSDRIMQLPRREYSHAAITSRKKLTEKAYVVLSDPRERKAYDKLYLAHAYGADGSQNTAVAVEIPARDNGDVNSLNLSIEIAPEELVGALLLLQELGEYELVLKLGRPYLINRNNTAASTETNFPAVERPDVILTVALACLELGREQWQQSHYENAAISLETGEELLAREGLFPSVRSEIQADLYRLRPYRIFELLALPDENTTQRTQGLQLLQHILDERGGIDGTGNDKSGLNIDDFLRFIQQLRNYMTVAEQHQLFEAESKRPSSVATYLAFYASLARGFTQCQPALIRQGKQLLVRLGKRQDVHLEQSLCALLLGQTEEATRALELSQEYEALVFIRENSQDSPDLLPGLCRYGEHWLQNDVFPHFRDLVNRDASLKDYFADQHVQAYLETLPTEIETTHESATSESEQSFSHTQTLHQSRRSPTTRTPYTEPSETRNQQRLEQSNLTQPSYTQVHPSSAVGGKTEISMTPLSGTEHYAEGNYHNLNGSVRATTAPSQQQQPRRRKRISAARQMGYVVENRSASPRRRSLSRNKQALRLLWMVVASGAAIILLWVTISTTVGLFRNLFSPAPTLKGEQVAAELNQPIVPIPDLESKPQLPTGSLTRETAGEIIQAWLDTKASAFGPEHEISSLEDILVGATLAKWRSLVQKQKVENRYRKYEHIVKVESLEAGKPNENSARVEAAVTEATDFYENGQKKRSEKERLRVRYNLIRTEGGWRIRDMSVLNKI